MRRRRRASDRSGSPRRLVRGSGARLTFELELRRWQTDALAAWEANGRRGIVAAATGTGKTRLALAAIARFFVERCRVVVVTPTIALQQQWISEMTRAFRLKDTQIGRMGSSSQYVHDAHALIVAVINSARDGLPAMLATWRAESRSTFLVADECHWAGATHNARMFSIETTATLGLSATPERSDDGLDEILVPALGPIVFRYPLRDALDDGLLAPLRCINLYVDLSAAEWEQVEVLNNKLRALEARLIERHPKLQILAGIHRTRALQRLTSTDAEAQSALSLMRQRQTLLGQADNRREAVAELFRSGILRSRRSLVFHERISEARRSFAILDSLGYRVAIESSLESDRARQDSLRLFRRGRVDVLVAVRTLDEGIDVPTADLAVITSSTLTVRQRIQRIGRVVRPSGKEGIVVSILARGTSEEWHIGAADAELVGNERVRHHRWPAVPINQILDDAPSSYGPDVWR